MASDRRDFLRGVAGTAGALAAGGEGRLEALTAEVPPAGARLEATWGLDVLNALLADKSNVVISILDCRLEGFHHNPDTTRVPYARRSDSGGRILARVPVAGTYYPGFIFYDGPGEERVSVQINGVERGVAVANADDNRDRLFFLSEPHQFQGGETIQLKALTDQGLYQTADLILLKQKPQARPLPYVFSDLFAQPDGSTAELTWITSWPARCTLEWGKETGSPLAAETESLAVANHRMWLRGLQPGQQYRFRVMAKDRDNRPVASPWQSFRAAQRAPARGTAKQGRLPLKIVSPDGAGSDRLFPVTAGVPFPKGVLGSEHHLRLVDAQGREVPLQTGTLARWPDGSVKWVLLDFQSAAASGQFTLEYGNGIGRQNAPSLLQLTSNEREITVSTGPLRLSIDKRGNGLPASLSIGSRVVIAGAHPGMLELTANDGTAYTSIGPPDEVIVEEAGPLRATVRVSGGYRAADGRRMFSYSVRLHAYAGQRYVRMEHTWGNDRGDEEFTSIRALRLRIPLVTAPASGGRGWRLGGYEDHARWIAGSQPIRLRQHTDDRYTITKGNEEEPFAEGKRSPGWAEWRDGVNQVTLAVRDFWQSYPKDITIGMDGLELGICPPLRTDEYEAAKGTIDEHRLYYYLQGGQYRFRQGMSQTQDIWLEVTPDSGNEPAMVQTQRSPLLALAPAQWYADSKAFGELAGPAEGGLLAQYDKAFAHGFDVYAEDREFQRAYGMLNFGDWYGERMIDWGNSEYDTQHGFLMQFLRTGERRYFAAAEQMEWHNRDVDTIHHHQDGSRIGAVYHHSIGHVGDYYRQSPVPKKGMLRGILTVDHVWLRGRLDYYFLTGEWRSLETARKIADRYDTYDTRNYDFKSCRMAGWHLILTMAIYEASQDRFYLNAGKILAGRVLERQTADGGWNYYWQACADTEKPVRYVNIGFMNGILLTGLRSYHAATGDEKVAQAIVRGARCLVDQLWVPETRTFRDVSCPPVPGSPLADLSFLLLDSIAFAHQRTQDPKLRQTLIEGTKRAVTGLADLSGERARKFEDGVGKQLGLYISNTAHFVGYVATLSS